MQTINLSHLFRLYYYTNMGYSYNKVNLNFKKQYSLFLKENESKLTYEELLMRPVVLKDYSEEYHECESFIKKIVMSSTKQEKIKELSFSDFSECIDAANVIINGIDGDYQEEFFQVENEDYQRLRSFFVNGIKMVHQRWAFTLKREEVLEQIPENAHSSFLDLHRKLSGKRLTGNPSGSFNALRNFFDVDDEEWLDEERLAKFKKK